MLRPGLLAALALLALVPLSAAVDPHPDHALTEGGPITALAMAAASGHVVTGREDPGDSVGERADERVWTLWDASGTAIFSGRADETDCAATTQITLNNCIGDVLDVAISADGTRIAIAARGNDNTEGRVLFIRQSGGAISTVANLETIGEFPTTLSGNADLTQLAVGYERGNAGRARLFAWTGPTPGVVSETWETDTATRISDIALGNDGRVAAAGGTSHYRFSATGVAFPDTAPSEAGGTIASVAFSRATADHYSVATTTAGEVLLYQDDHDVGNPAPPSIPLGSSPKRASAMSGDGMLFAAGDDAGVVRLYRNLDLSQAGGQTYLVAQSAALGGAVTALQFSLDGKYLVVASAVGTHLMRTTNAALTPMWTHASAAVVDADLLADASSVVSAVGSSATVFTAVRSASVTATGNGTVQPGQATKATLTVRNTGNREDTITLDPPAFPSGWIGNLSRTSMTLAPDATATVTLNVTPSAGAAPGTAKVGITHRQAGASSVTTQVNFAVAQVHQWSLVAEGAISKTLDAGESVTFTFKATNLGNGQDTTAVTVGVDRSGWSAAATPTTLSAAPGQSVSGTVTIRAPETAAQLASASATVELGADNDATLKLTATIGARFGVDAVADPGDSDGVRGQATAFKLRLTNTGNAPDTFVTTPSGVPAGWLVTMVPLGATPVVAPGATTEIDVQVVPATDAVTGNYQIDFKVASQGDPTAGETVPHLVRVPADDAGTSTKSKKDSPGLGVGLALLALAAVALAARRR